MTARPPYRLSDWPTLIAFSGGESSGYMLWHILQAHHGALPPHAAVVFSNTGLERPETLDFVAACADRWDVPITWLEYRHNPHALGGPSDPKNGYAVVSRDTASLDGRPFTDLVLSKVFLPHQGNRLCTAELKVRNARRYLRRERGWPANYRSAIGFRADESRRWAEIVRQDDCLLDVPMVYAGVTRHDVDAFWRRQNFRLGITSAEGNCTLCFMKGARKLKALIRHRPQDARWWIDTERLIASTSTRLDADEKARFSLDWTYRELYEAAMNSGQTALDLYPEDAPVDCFCAS